MPAESTPDASSAESARPQARARKLSMRDLLAAGAAARAVSTPPSAPPGDDRDEPAQARGKHPGRPARAA